MLSTKSPPSAGDSAEAETVTVTGSLDVGLRTAVTVLTPPFSPIRAGVNTSVTAGAPSSSMIFSIFGIGGSAPLPPVTVPVTSTVRFGPSKVSSSAVIFTIPSARGRTHPNRQLAILAEDEAFPGTETARDRIGSAAPARPNCENCSEDGEADDASTFTLMTSLDGTLSVALTSLCPPSSIVLGLRSRITLGVASSSVIVSSCTSGSVTPLTPWTDPLTSTVLSGASMSLFTASIVTVPVLCV